MYTFIMIFFGIVYSFVIGLMHYSSKIWFLNYKYQPISLAIDSIFIVGCLSLGLFVHHYRLGSYTNSELV